jgi:hypothetical protein
VLPEEGNYIVIELEIKEKSKETTKSARELEMKVFTLYLMMMSYTLCSFIYFFYNYVFIGCL